ncbi:zinc finger protein rotund-like [Wyeomyia smithii]|uniref:zinc finger protein rotund-like n=1 Tax=Wyeomyia smithii TaxID=174621 RepID=UPI0024681174|nr:zinc finger protein rotund-like [Wyeomyia smithii]
MDTPKRIKTIASHYVSSPPNGVLSGLESTTPVGNNHDPVHQHTSWSSGGWPPETLRSPASNCSSPEALFGRIGTPTGPNSGNASNGWKQQTGSNSAEKSENKRGRPRSEALTTLMVEGSISPSAIKCRYCNRVFPREKSLQAHLRTHTGERPYQCDYPGCTRAFTQSGQLKTHQRLHTGERPFICSAINCQMRFTHANRHCPDHPYDTLKRCDDFVIQTVPEQNGEVLKWLEKYRAEREDRTPTRKTPKRTSHATQNENENQPRPATNNENYMVNGTAFQSPMTPRSPFKSRKGLMCELDMNAGMGLSASPITAKTKPNVPKLIQWQEPTSQEEDDSGDESHGGVTIQHSTFNPKKKWLRDAWQEDLAKPLEPSLISPQALSSTTSTAALKQQLNQESAPVIHETVTVDPNQMRPTVLMVASKDCARPLNDQPAEPRVETRTRRPEETNRKLQGALALMQLATEDSVAALMMAAPFEPVDTQEVTCLNNTPPTIPQSTTCSSPAMVVNSYLEQRPLRIPMLSYRPGEIDHSIPFTLAAEAVASSYHRL